MSVKVIIEIGHEATLKHKATNGFTHDWELYVKGCDQNDISHFVEKVVFNLHSSFPKPKRVIKEPPYCLKESGYAGFVLPIDIYLKNRDEPKKVTYNYDLVLQTAGPYTKTQKEKIVINTPSDDFRRKLIKGGGVLISNISSNLDDKNKDFVDDRSQLISKPKLGGDKKYNKYRPEDSKASFANLFGTPITKTSSKVSPDSKTKLSPKPLAIPKNIEKLLLPKEKIDKIEKDKTKHKHSSPYKDKELNRKNDDKREEKKKEKSHSKERERSREKTSKKPASPKRSPKRLNVSPPRSSSAASSENNSKLKHLEQNLNPSNKKSKKDKKDKGHDKDRDRENRGKDHKKEKDEKIMSINNKFNLEKVESKPKENNISKDTIKDKHKTIDYNKISGVSSSSGGSGVGIICNNEITNNIDLMQQKPIESVKKSDKHEKDSERKHKHKKKEKIKKDDLNKEKEHVKEKKKDKERVEKNKQKDDTNSLFLNKNNKSQELKQYEQSQTKSGTPLNALMDEISERDSTDTEMSSPVIEKPEAITETSNSSIHDDSKVPKLPKKSKEKLIKNMEKEDKKRKRKIKDDHNDGNSMDPPITKVRRENGDNSTNSLNKIPMDDEQITINDRNMPIDYMTELKELQHKIMTLQDNNELQQVVEMIAPTGKFEITSKTFDFDLCTLDRNTVQQLQEFFATS